MAIYKPMPRSEHRRAPAADFVLPFDLPDVGLRGRMVRLDVSSARALSAHKLPEDAARVAAETVALATLLGTSLKLDGRLTIQTKSDGPLDLVTADYFGAQDGKRQAKPSQATESDEEPAAAAEPAKKRRRRRRKPSEAGAAVAATQGGEPDAV